MIARIEQDKSVTPATQPRKPGRPRGGAINAEQREHLLNIALRLFAQQGIANTSLNAIAREAGVSPAMLHYYFSSRDALLDVMIDERFVPLRLQLSDIFTTHADDPLTAFSKMAEHFAAIAAQHHWFAPLWLQEMSGETPLLKKRLHERFGHQGRHAVLATIERWQQEGKINAALSPHLLVSTLLSVILVPTAQLQSGTLDAAVDREMILSHALALLTRGMLS